MEFNKNNVTTIVTTLLLTLFSYLGIAQATQSMLIQVLAPIIAIIIGVGMNYLNEKYPSDMVTSVSETSSVDEDGL